MEEIDFNNRVDNRIKILQQQQPQEPQIKEVPFSFMPRYHCSDGHCGTIHKNESFRDYPRAKCTNCDQFSKGSSKKCPWCGNDDFDILDDDDLDDIINYKEEKSGWW